MGARMKLSAWIEKKLKNPEFRNQYISEMDGEITKLKSALADRDAELEKNWCALAVANEDIERADAKYQSIGRCLKASEADLKKAEATIAEYSAGWEKMRSFAEYIESDYDHDSDAHKYNTPCRCCEAEKFLSLKKPSVSKAGDEPQPNREERK